MKVIPTNIIDTVAASAEDSEYIADWVIEYKPKKIWKSDSTSGTLTLTTEAANHNVIALYNHNADNISITIKTVGGGSTIDGPYTHDLSGYSYGNTMLWQEYDDQTVARDIEVAFTNGREDPVQCGIAWVGEYFSFGNPLPGLQFSYIDNHIKYKMSSRSIKYIEKDLKKIFTFNTIEEDDNWWSLIKKLKNYIGYNSVPWLLLDNRPRTHNIFGYISDFDMGNYEYPFIYRNSLEIIER